MYTLIQASEWDWKEVCRNQRIKFGAGREELVCLCVYVCLIYLSVLHVHTNGKGMAGGESIMLSLGTNNMKMGDGKRQEHHRNVKTEIK